MPQAVELARFKVKEGAEDALLAERDAMLQALRATFPAARDAFLTRLDDGTWLDIVLWEDRAAAERAAAEVFEHPAIASWFRHIDEVVAMEHGELAAPA